MLFNTRQAALYYGGIALSLVFSASGVWWAVYRSGTCVDGQRGGAIGTATAFFILFLRIKYGDFVFGVVFEGKKNADLRAKFEQYKKDGITPDLTQRELSSVVFGILDRSNVETEEQLLQNIALFAASAIGTIAWGFGDIIASWSCKCN